MLFHKVNLKNAALVWVSFMLAGCSFAPGITLSASHQSQDSTGGVPLPQWIKAMEPSSKPGNGLPSGETTNPAVLLPITAELIRLQRSLIAADASQEVKRLFDTAKPYTIGPNDVLNVVVWDHPQLNLPSAASGAAADASSISSVGNGYNVNAEGAIQFPYVGLIKLSGMTETQARQALIEKLSKFIKNPDVLLRVQAYRSGRIYVDGEVRSPGGISINDVALTLPEAIARVGGFLATADRTSVTITRGGTTTLVNLPQLARLGLNPGQILLASGDTVQVVNRDESKVFVLGEVSRPSSLPMRNGRMTLSEALGESGGISQVSGNARQVFVLRDGGGVAEVYHLDISNSSSYILTSSFDLKPRDVVFVDPSPLVRFNRVINLLIPGAALASSVDPFKK